MCPNCGSRSSRENLLDGCDYCNTKFAVTDLGKRISSFALRKDYEVEYEKYKDKRKFFEKRAFLAGAVPAFILSLIGLTVAAFKQQEGVVISIAVSILGAFFLAGAIGFFSKIGFFMFIFPIIQVKHSAKYAILKRFKENDTKNLEIVDKIRKYDPLFSREYFFSNIQNKLATVHYADKSEQISVFSLTDMKNFIEKYRDVVDMDVTGIELKSVSLNENEFRIELNASLNLICLRNSGFCETGETVLLSLVKNTSCKTEAVCEPSIFTCKGCGCSISLLDGGKCQYCDTVLNLRDFDWVIEDYRIM